jgi:lysylphosphatidylglycerol synthetase-like protein (DUF2156 family)
VSRHGRRLAALIGITVFIAVASQLAALAVNEASSASRWPGVLDHIRAHPFLSAAILSALVVVAGVLLVLLERRPRAAQQPDRTQTNIAHDDSTIYAPFNGDVNVHDDRR